MALAVSFIPVARLGTKGSGSPGWETGTTGVSQPGQISVFVVVIGPPLKNQGIATNHFCSSVSSYETLLSGIDLPMICYIPSVSKRDFGS